MPVNALPGLDVRSEEWRDSVLRLDRTEPLVARLALAAEGFIRRAIYNDRSHGSWFVIAGPTGCGKTHTAKAILRQFAAWGPTSVAAGKRNKLQWDFQDWSAMLSKSFESRMEELQDVDFLCLDDVGSESDTFRSGEHAGQLRRVLEMFAHRWLVVTTNVPRGKWGEAFDARVASRLSSGGYVAMFGAKDWRLNAKTIKESFSSLLKEQGPKKADSPATL